MYSGGGYLDGLGTGVAGSGDYTTTFTVSTAANSNDVVWVPSVAEGPGDVLNAPGNDKQTLFAGGYPVYINDATGVVTNVQLVFNYDPTLLVVTGATSNPNLPGSSFTLDSGSSTPGHAVLRYSDSGSNAALLTGGQVPLGFITASVPRGTSANPMPYGHLDLLHLSNVVINGGAVPVTAIDALHLEAYIGDGDGNAMYTSHDATLIVRVSLQADSGFVYYPLVDPVIAADTDGDGFIPADAALQVNEVGVGLPAPNILPIPIGVFINFSL